MQHLSSEQIEAGLGHVRESPAADGTLDLVVQRPASDARVLLEEGHLDPLEGLVGDDWSRRPSRTSADGGPHPLMQIAIANSRFLALLAGTAESPAAAGGHRAQGGPGTLSKSSADKIAPAGDQLIVDLDLSEANLPAGTVLGIGDAALEITDEPHLGCAKFSARYGLDALRAVNSAEGRQLRLRGVYARVVQAGTVRPGDRIRKLR